MRLIVRFRESSLERLCYASQVRAKTQPKILLWKCITSMKCLETGTLSITIKLLVTTIIKLHNFILLPSTTVECIDKQAISPALLITINKVRRRETFLARWAITNRQRATTFIKTWTIRNYPKVALQAVLTIDSLHSFHNLIRLVSSSIRIISIGKDEDNTIAGVISMISSRPSARVEDEEVDGRTKGCATQTQWLNHTATAEVEQTFWLQDLAEIKGNSAILMRTKSH